MIGTVISHYKILREIGRGGMGVVYLAEHTESKKRFAIKILPPELKKKPGFKEQFLREADILSDLNHPNIVRVYDFGVENNVYYIRLELVLDKTGQPKTLSNLMQQGNGVIPQKLFQFVYEFD